MPSTAIWPGGRREQQVFQILAEDFDGFEIGALLQFEADFGLDGEIEQALVAILDGEFEMRRPVARPFEDLAFQIGEGALGGRARSGSRECFRSRRGGWRACGAKEFSPPARGTRNTF